jgi:hypothetical protein
MASCLSRPFNFGTGINPACVSQTRKLKPFVDRNGQCAVNHRGGKCGFISVSEVQGEARVLLPDYAGNGAFEAVGNIWETGRAAVFVPDPERG